MADKTLMMYRAKDSPFSPRPSVANCIRRAGASLCLPMGKFRDSLPSPSLRGAAAEPW
jgi:hypothetical protein